MSPRSAPAEPAPALGRAASSAVNLRVPRSLSSHRWPTILAGVRANRPAAVALAVALAVGWGLVARWWTPRGPVTTGEALGTLGTSLAVGLVAGFATRSRWAMLVTPVVFILTLELARLPLQGPSVDGVRLSAYGLIAFATGRGFHALVVLVPMLLGVALGAGLGRRLHHDDHRGRIGRYLRRGVAAATAVALLALVVALARPARTAPIVGPDGVERAGSVAELIRVDVGGHELAMMIRGESVDNPVLLFLAGGPGGTELGAMRHHGQILEKDFTVVTWDQRGTGKSYAELDPTATLSLDRAVRDTIEVVNYLRSRFQQEKIYLLGQSWGTILGVFAVQQQPQLFAAFIGTGQMVSPRETDRIFYADTLAWARRTGNADLVDPLTRSGPPPYQSMGDYETTLAHEQEVYPYDRSRNAEGQGQMAEGIFVEEYSLTEQIHNLAAVLDTFAVMYPQIQGVDLRRDATRLDVPVFLFQGRHEPRGRADLADEWFSMLTAPSKQQVVADTSGHRPLWEQPDLFATFMTGTVLAATAPGR